MENKALVYAVLAISLGYLLVSAVPSQLAPPMFSATEDSELLKEPAPGRAESPAEDASAPLIEQDDTFSGDAAEAQGEVFAAEGGSSNLVISVFGTMSVNLLLALGVYMVARRRYS
jgi:hypothetical protein